MTTFDRFERSIPELMTELAPARVPDYFDDMLQRTEGATQRPAWSFPERWLPVDIAARPLVTRSFPWRPLAVLALIALLVAAGLAVYVGSQNRVPPPFGVAGNGTLLFRGLDGTISSLDPSTGTLTSVAPASDALGEPIPSRDGKRVAFITRGDAPGRIVIAAIDGSRRVTLPGSYPSVDPVDWSPDGSHIAFTSFDGTRASITVAATDGSSVQTLPLDRDVWQIAYLPDGRLAAIAADRPGDSCPVDRPDVRPCALFVVNPDGTGLDRLISAEDFRGINTISPAPDGSKLLWVEWDTGAEGRLHVFDLASRTDQRLADDAFPHPYSINNAWFSPDASAILFDLFEVDGDHWAVVPAAGGPPVRLGQKIPRNGTRAAWAPDGRSVLARYPTSDTTSELWQLDATGAGGDRRLEVDVPYLPTWQRVAP